MYMKNKNAQGSILPNYLCNTTYVYDLQLQGGYNPNWLLGQAGEKA